MEKARRVCRVYFEPHNTKIYSFGTDSEWLLYEAIKSSESGLGGYAAVRREEDECVDAFAGESTQD